MGTHGLAQVGHGVFSGQNDQFIVPQRVQQPHHVQFGSAFVVLFVFFGRLFTGTNALHVAQHKGQVQRCHWHVSLFHFFAKRRAIHGVVLKLGVAAKVGTVHQHVVARALKDAFHLCQLRQPTAQGTCQRHHLHSAVFFLKHGQKRFCFFFVGNFFHTIVKVFFAHGTVFVHLVLHRLQHRVQLFVRAVLLAALGHGLQDVQHLF